MTAVLEGIRVLVVEDEFLVATLIEDMLMSAGLRGVGPYSATCRSSRCGGSRDL